MLALKVTFSYKGYFFQIVILNARLWFAFRYDALYIELNDVKWQTFA